MLFVVTNFKINDIFKRESRFFKVNLGLSSTMEKGNLRLANESDKFAYYYNNMYKTTIYAQGSMGNIKFYTDHYIKEDKLAIYYNYEEFVFDFEPQIVKEKGVDFYLGHLIKKIETENNEIISKKEEEMENQKVEVGNAEKVYLNPGNVRYSDIKAYIEQKRQERLKSQ